AVPVQPGSSSKHGVPGDPLREARRWGTSRSVTLCSACSPTAGGNNPGYEATSRPHLATGLPAPVWIGLRPNGGLPRHESIPATTGHAPIFIILGAAERHEGLGSVAHTVSVHEKNEILTTLG